MNGEAKSAITYSLIGNATGTIITTLFIPLIIIVLPLIYNNTKDYTALILIIITLFVISKGKNKILSLTFFITTGILGIISFNIKTIDQPLLPLLSGIFGLSGLILCIKNKIILPEQRQDVKSKLSKLTLIKNSVTTAISSFLTNFLPGLTSSHTAFISNKISKIKDQDEYIILSNSASSSATLISCIALYSISKTRSGMAIAIQSLITTINKTNLILIIAISLMTLAIATFLAINISNKVLIIVNKLDYKKISLAIILIIIIFVLVITGLEGLVILITSTSIGILAEKLNIERINLTGCLILPVILYLHL